MAPLPHHVMLCVGLAVILLVIPAPVEGKKVEVPQDFIQKLFDMTSDLQVKEEVPLIPLKQFYRQKGVYPSGVKLNFHGKTDYAEARRLLEVFDNNMFATAWVTSSLLEAYRYGRAPRPTEEQLLIAIESLQKHVDYNKPYNNSLMFFWPVQYSEQDQFWQATPTNLIASFNATDYVPLDVIVAIMDLMGLKNLTGYIEHILKSKDGYIHVFHLCPDMDDTFLNLGLGSLLYDLREEFPSAWNLWHKNNNNITSIFDALKKYSYRPFNKDLDISSIDPRTYMYLRFFLDDAVAQGKDVALVSTWVQNREELMMETLKGVTMPLNINNVDSTVCANTVFGITAGVLTGMLNKTVLEDPLIAQIYHNASALMAYEINTNISSRPDLALLYYPSHMEFNWFVSRTVAMMDVAKREGPLPLPVMEEVYTMLQTALKTKMTDYVLKEAKYDEVGNVYFDDFLGDGDFTEEGRPLERGEDRIFTTSMAVNALLYTWTDYDEQTQKATWKKDVPDVVKQVVDKSVQWLIEHTLDGNYDPWNAFFSGSGKGSTTSPSEYPANLHEYLNGTIIPDPNQRPNYRDDILAVKGYIKPADYAAMLKKERFGRYSPLDFHGYNSSKGFFPFWTSEPYAYSIAMLALSRYGTLEG